MAKRVSSTPNSEAIANIMAQTEAAGLITFSGGFPSPDIFPAAVVTKLTAQLLAEEPEVTMQYSPTRGLSSVRDAIARWLSGRGELGLSTDELIITSGGMDALGLLAKSYLDPGDMVIVEAPTYLGAIMSFASFQAETVGVAVDDGGMDVDAVADLLAKGMRPKLLYTIPDGQNPTGCSLSIERRHTLVELCRRYGVLVVEDVAYRELGFSDERAPSLWSLAPDTVVQIGTFSKIFFPGVRLGWALGSQAVLKAMVGAKQLADQCAGSLGQRLIEDYLRGRYMDDWLPDARDFYQRRSHAMMQALELTMPEGTRWTRPTGGFFTWLTAPHGIDTSALSPRATSAGISYVPGETFYPHGGNKNEIRLSFSCVPESDIAEGIGRLATLFTHTSSQINKGEIQ
ncbi:MAG TPA: PLP-dependent aminotransferase family protein [Acidimicrobiales bacterium]|nr:PLP-dependent aminotransferase family protein [Acidimicrobiales bacterium]